MKTEQITEEGITFIESSKYVETTVNSSVDEALISIHILFCEN